MLVYEAPLLRNITTRDLPLIQISGIEVRETLQLTRQAFVDFALLLGSDFSQRLNGLGPSRAIKLIQSKGSIEAIIESERAKEKGQRFLPEPRLSEEQYLEQIIAGREVFQTLPPLSDELRARLSWPRTVDESAVADILRGFDLGADFRHEDVRINPLDVDYYYLPSETVHEEYTYV